MHDAQQNGWLTLAEAAAALGVSPDTVRRRIRRGDLVATHHARQVRVRVDGMHSNLHGSNGVHGSLPGNAVQEQSEGLLEALRLVDRLQRENRDLAGLVGQLQERVSTLQHQLALPAPVMSTSPERPLERDSDASTVERAQESSESKRSVPWWQFWH